MMSPEEVQFYNKRKQINQMNKMMDNSPNLNTDESEFDPNQLCNFRNQVHQKVQSSEQHGDYMNHI